MHYKNGREAKNGDRIVLISQYGEVRTGILHDAKPDGGNSCNGLIAQVSSDFHANLADCLHADDAAELFKAVKKPGE